MDDSAFRECVQAFNDELQKRGLKHKHSFVKWLWRRGVKIPPAPYMTVRQIAWTVGLPVGIAMAVVNYFISFSSIPWPMGRLAAVIFFGVGVGVFGGWGYGIFMHRVFKRWKQQLNLPMEWGDFRYSPSSTN